MTNEEKILAMLSEMKSDISELKTTQAEQGKQLAELAEMQEELRTAVNRVAFKQENIVIPSLRTIAQSHKDLREELATKERLEEVSDSVGFALTGIKTHSEQIADLTERVAKLEKAN